MNTHPKARYAEAVRAELVKFSTVRSTVVVTAVLAAALPALALIVAATESLQPDDTILGASVLGGAVIAQVLAASLGATLVTGEYRTGMVLSTLTACPRRLVVLAAKATVAAGVTFVVVLPSAGFSHLIGLVLLD